MNKEQAKRYIRDLNKNMKVISKEISQRQPKVEPLPKPKRSALGIFIRGKQ